MSKCDTMGCGDPATHKVLYLGQWRTACDEHKKSQYWSDSGTPIQVKKADMNCSVCEKEIAGFRNEASKKESEYSGMCESCQDDFFGPELKVTASTGKKECPSCGHDMVEREGNLECDNCGHGKPPKVAKNASNQSGGSFELPDWITNAQSDWDNLESKESEKR